MEPVPPDAVFLIVFVRHAEHIRLGGHGLMERRVKHRHLGHVLAEGGHGGVDALHMGGIMQRGQGGIPLDVREHLCVDAHRFIILGAALHHPVPDGGYLGEVVDDFSFPFGQSQLHLFEGGGVIRHGDFLRHHPAVSRLVGEPAVDSDALAQPFGHDHLAVHVDELILEGGTACVDDQNFHACTQSFRGFALSRATSTIAFCPKTTYTIIVRFCLFFKGFSARKAGFY